MVGHCIVNAEYLGAQGPHIRVRWLSPLNIGGGGGGAIG